jgi:hypothetical protein
MQATQTYQILLLVLAAQIGSSWLRRWCIGWAFL